MDGFALNDSDFRGDFSRTVASCARSHHPRPLLWVLPCLALLCGQALLIGGVGPTAAQFFGPFGASLWRLGLLCILASCLIACLAALLLLPLHASDASRADFRVGPVTVVGRRGRSAAERVYCFVLRIEAASSYRVLKGFARSALLRLGIALPYFRHLHQFRIWSLAAAGEITQDAALFYAGTPPLGDLPALGSASIGTIAVRPNYLDFWRDASGSVAHEDFVQPPVSMTAFTIRLREVFARALGSSNADVERLTKVFVSDTTLDEGVEVGCHAATIERK